MNVLDKILEEIKEKCVELSKSHWGDDECHLVGKGIQSMYIQTEKIIRFHMDDVTDTNIPSNDGWISVEDGLPEEKGDITKDFNLFMKSLYLITDGTGVIIALFDDGCFRDVDDRIPYEDAIAWRPLPEPYKPKEAQVAGHIMNRFMKVE